MKLKSKRNYVEKLDTGNRSIVRKHFYSMDAWRTELENHARISGLTPLADILTAVPGLIVSEYIPHPHMLDVLEKQEEQGFDAHVWGKFASWLKELAGKSRILPAEGNLRNFIWNDDGGEVIPVDLEHWNEIPFAACAAGIVAFLMEYEPAGSCVKRSAAELLMKAWGLREDTVARERMALKERRSRRAVSKDAFSVIILAGGLSQRMGVGKAKIDLYGKTLLEHQIETAHMLGTDDVLISGAPEYTASGDSVADELPCRGPLGGIYSCMKRAKYEKCVVMSVDMPALTAAMITELLRVHTSGITVAAHDGTVEPLVGVYDTSLCEKIGCLIAEKGVSVRKLMQQTAVRQVDFCGNDALWHNCNTPAEFQIYAGGNLTQNMLKNI